MPIPVAIDREVGTAYLFWWFEMENELTAFCCTVINADVVIRKRNAIVDDGGCGEKGWLRCWLLC